MQMQTKIKYPWPTSSVVQSGWLESLGGGGLVGLDLMLDSGSQRLNKDVVTIVVELMGAAVFSWCVALENAITSSSFSRKQTKHSFFC